MDFFAFKRFENNNDMSNNNIYNNNYNNNTLNFNHFNLSSSNSKKNFRNLFLNISYINHLNNLNNNNNNNTKKSFNKNSNNSNNSNNNLNNLNINNNKVNYNKRRSSGNNNYYKENQTNKTKTFLFMEKMKKQMNFNIESNNDLDNSILAPEDKKERNEILKKFKNNVHPLNSSVNKGKEGNDFSGKNTVAKIYYGEFKENNIEGFGVEYNLNGFKIEGEWKNNEMHGFVSIEYDPGEKFVGEIFYGKIKSGEFYDKDNNELYDKKRINELIALIGI